MAKQLRTILPMVLLTLASLSLAQGADRDGQVIRPTLVKSELAPLMVQKMAVEKMPIEQEYHRQHVQQFEVFRSVQQEKIHPRMTVASLNEDAYRIGTRRIDYRDNIIDNGYGYNGYYTRTSFGSRW